MNCVHVLLQGQREGSCTGKFRHKHTARGGSLRTTQQTEDSPRKPRGTATRCLLAPMPRAPGNLRSPLLHLDRWPHVGGWGQHQGKAVPQNCPSCPLSGCPRAVDGAAPHPPACLGAQRGLRAQQQGLTTQAAESTRFTYR